jgi:hypothetical protein
MTKLRLILLVLASTSCAADDGDTTAADTGATSEAEGSASLGSTSASPGTDGTETVTDTATDPSASATDPSDTDVDDGSSSGDPTPATTGSADTGSESTGGPTSGPGVLPGEGGLEAFCRRYVECGGTYYADEQACIDASYDYWGDCASRAAALDAFGACMAEIECSDWSPDAYNPASTPCAEQWQGVGASDPC